MSARFWNTCRVEEKLIILLCGAILVFCAGSEWARRQKPLPPLFHQGAAPQSLSR